MTESRVFFPLRTNVDYFASPEAQLSLRQRIKQASILYDAVILEGGIYRAAIGERGAWDFHVPQSQITDELLLPDNHITEDETFSVQAFIPSVGPRTFLQSNLTHKFFCEYETVRREASIDGVNWLDMQEFDLTPSGKTLVKRAQKIIEKLVAQSFSAEERFLRGKIATNLGRDLHISQELAIPISINISVADTLLPSLAMQPAPGWTALQVAVPDFSNLGWGEIGEIRKTQSCGNFREKLLEIEAITRTALELGQIDAARVDLSIAQNLLMELRNEIVAESPTAIKKILSAIPWVLIDLVTSIFIPVPFVGTAMSTVGSIAVDIWQTQNRKNAWTSAYYRLNQPAKKI